MFSPLADSVRGRVNGLSSETTDDRQNMIPDTNDRPDFQTVWNSGPLMSQDSGYTETTAAESTTATSFDHLWDAIERARVSKMSGGPSSSTDTKTFIGLLKAQVAQIADGVAYDEQYQERSCKLLLSATDDGKLKDQHGDHAGNPTYVRIQAEDLIQSSLRLRHYVTKMKESLETVAACADEVLGTDCTSMLRQLTSVAPWKEPNSTLAVVLSDIYEVIRSSENPTTSSSAKWEAPSSFERATTKYWVEKDQLGDLLYTCAKELPLLVYGKSGRLTSKEDLNSTENDKLWKDLATKISSVYFDSPNLALYKERIARREGAQLLRVRWYGEKPQGDDKVFVELKTHHEKWINVSSVKERVTIMEKHMSLFLTRKPWDYQDALPIVSVANPKLKGAELDTAVDLLVRMHQLVLEKDLRPCVRSVYLRAAFQLPTSNALRLTLDRDVTMIDERNAPFGAWSLPAGTPMSSSMLKVVPYPVFEVKLAGSDMPEPLVSLITDGVIIEATKFSKFLSGAAAFNSERVKTLPYWAENPAFQEMFQASGKFQSDPPSSSKSLSILPPPSTTKSSVARKSISSDSVSLSKRATGKRSPTPANKSWFPFLNKSSKTAIAPKRPARVEPKSFFANERTFIQWSSAALWLLTVAALIVEREVDGTTYLTSAGIALCVGSIILLFHAIKVYFRRIKLMETGNPNGYVDKFGPLVLTSVVFIGVVVLLVEKTKNTGILPTNSSSQEEVTTAYQEQGLCFQHLNNGISNLGYQPSDVMVDQDRGILLVPSLAHIVGHSTTRLTTRVVTLAEIPGADLEGLTNVGDRVFALSEAVSEVGKSSLLFELAWQNEGQLGVVQHFDLGAKDSDNEGITYIPDASGESGSLCVDRGGGRLDLYNLPPPSQNSPQGFYQHNNVAPQRLTRRDGLNQKLITNGLKDGKIAGLHYFEGILYVLHDNDKVVRSWEISTGTLLSEFTLPQLPGGSFDQQWEGFAIERNNGNFPPLANGSGNLRRSGNNPSLKIHLALDSPPQIWSFAVDEGETKGKLVFPECSGMQNTKL